MISTTGHTPVIQRWYRFSIYSLVGSVWNDSRSGARACIRPCRHVSETTFTVNKVCRRFGRTCSGHDKNIGSAIVIRYRSTSEMVDQVRNGRVAMCEIVLFTFAERESQISPWFATDREHRELMRLICIKEPGRIVNVQGCFVVTTTDLINWNRSAVRVETMLIFFIEFLRTTLGIPFVVPELLGSISNVFFFHDVPM